MATADETGQGVEVAEEEETRPLCDRCEEAPGQRCSPIKMSLIGLVVILFAIVGWFFVAHPSTTTGGPKAPTVECPDKSGRQLKWANHPELCITTGLGASNGSPVNMALCDDSDPMQLFVFSGEVDKIRLASNPDFCLDIKDHSTVNGNTVQVWECIEGDTDQHFVIKDKIHWSTHQEVCLDVRNHQVRPGTVLQIWECIDGDTDQHLPPGPLQCVGPPPPRTWTQCPGEVKMSGYGNVQVLNTPNSPSKVGGDAVVAYMTGRSYFGDACTEGTFDPNQYLALKLLGKRIRFTTDLSGSQCGCNAAFYMTSMHQNTQVSTCHDYYCDANNVCGERCTEVDIMEASMRAFRSTLHADWDGGGKGIGVGGSAYTWTTSEYGPGGSCIDTTKPFEVSAGFPVDAAGTLTSMDIELTQNGCSLSGGVSGYWGQGRDLMPDVSRSLAAGMTPILSYWKSDRMGWLDGNGHPCATETPDTCAETASFSDFAVEDLNSVSA